MTLVTLSLPQAGHPLTPQLSDPFWPSQTAPRAVVKSTPMEHFGTVVSPNGKATSGPLGATHMMVQSVAGLTAQAVNEGRLDEMVWIGTTKADYAMWYKGMVHRLGLEERGTLAPWSLVRRYQEKGVIKGYVLYSYDHSEGQPFTPGRKGIDHSANVATVVAGLMQGILIEEGQEDEAKDLGLPLLFDARGKTEKWCFDTYRDRLSRSVFVSMDPKAPNNRAIAIAHRGMVCWGAADPVPAVLAWLNPLTPILGWGEDEWTYTRLVSQYGHFQTACNWSINEHLLCAGTESWTPSRRFKSIDPAEIDWNDKRPAAAFVMSDGDNVQWLMGNFCLHKDYWAAPLSGRFPFGWTTCVAEMMSICPEVVEYLVHTQKAGASVVEYGAGYHFPDIFGALRPEPDLLARHARRVSETMGKSGIRIFGFICINVDSPEARAAYEIYAREIDGLAGMLAVQFTPYEGGEGRIYWVKNRAGVDIPVVTARYSLWANLDFPGSGTPARIARLINEDAQKAIAAGETTGSWTIVHSWSSFGKIRGNDEKGENVTKGAKVTGVGVAPTKWCLDRLSPGVHVVGIEELVWRLRMQHDPQTTQQLAGAPKTARGENAAARRDNSARKRSR
jgi:hypothetical protein